VVETIHLETGNQKVTQEVLVAPEKCLLTEMVIGIEKGGEMIGIVIGVIEREADLGQSSGTVLGIPEAVQVRMGVGHIHEVPCPAGDAIPVLETIQSRADV